MALVEEQSLRIDGANAANIAPLASTQIVDDEMIARVAHGVEQAALFIVEQAAAALLRDERVPPDNFARAGVESKEHRAAKAPPRVVQGIPRPINGQTDRR